MKILMIACEILFREISWCVSQSKNIVDTRFLTKGLHDLGEKEMSMALQEEIDRVDPKKYEAVLLGYALCNNGIRGLVAGDVPLVVPRAHDCITLLLGSRDKYKEYHDKNPGTYYKSTGWMERDAPAERSGIHTQLQWGLSPEEYVKKYGEENAKYIMEVMGSWEKNYSKIAYIDLGIIDLPDYESSAREEAKNKGWQFEKIKGDISLLKCLIDGDWNNEDFLIVKPGQKITASYNEEIIKTV